MADSEISIVPIPIMNNHPKIVILNAIPIERTSINKTVWIILFITVGRFAQADAQRWTALCRWGIEFRLPVTEVQFIDKCSLLFLLLNVIRQAATAADDCK